MNIGSGSEISIRDLTELIAEMVGYQGEVVWDTPVTDDMCKLGIRWINLDGEARSWLSHFTR